MMAQLSANETEAAPLPYSRNDPILNMYSTHLKIDLRHNPLIRILVLLLFSAILLSYGITSHAQQVTPSAEQVAQLKSMSASEQKALAKSMGIEIPNNMGGGGSQPDLNDPEGGETGELGRGVHAGMIVDTKPGGSVDKRIGPDRIPQSPAGHGVGFGPSIQHDQTVANFRIGQQ